MDPNPPGARPRSAFAAAVFSFIFPGLGHAYLGRWTRALAWAALPILAIALGGGLLVNPTTKDRLLEMVLTQEALTAVLLLVVVDLVYRVLCMLDAWRLARSPGGGGAQLAALLSVTGLIAVILVAGVS